MRNENNIDHISCIDAAGFYGAGAQTETHTGISFFNGTLKEAIARAKAENKFVFFDAYASWCGPCKMRDKEVFTDKTVADYLNAKFICVRIDMEKREGPVLAKKYPSINGYPSLSFLENGGMPVKTLLGSRNAEEFLAEARLVAK